MATSSSREPVSAAACGRLPKGVTGSRHRFAAYARDVSKGEEVGLGWSRDPEAFRALVEEHPSLTDLRVVDRAFELDLVFGWGFGAGAPPIDEKVSPETRAKLLEELPSPHLWVRVRTEDPELRTTAPRGDVEQYRPALVEDGAFEAVGGAMFGLPGEPFGALLIAASLAWSTARRRMDFEETPRHGLAAMREIIRGLRRQLRDSNLEEGARLARSRIFDEVDALVKVAADAVPRKLPEGVTEVEAQLLAALVLAALREAEAETRIAALEEQVAKLSTLGSRKAKGKA